MKEKMNKVKKAKNKKEQIVPKKVQFEDLGSIDFLLLIPTFDYECSYTTLINEVGDIIAKIRHKQKNLDRKNLRYVFENYLNLSEEEKFEYQVISMSAGAFFAEKFYKNIMAKCDTIVKIDDERAIELLINYDLDNYDKELAEFEAKRLLMDIIKERIFYDLLASNGCEDIYDVSLNNIHDTRIPDALSTYGLMQVLGTLSKENGIYIKVSKNSISYIEQIYKKQKVTECDILEYYQKYIDYHSAYKEDVDYTRKRIKNNINEIEDWD